MNVKTERARTPLAAPGLIVALGQGWILAILLTVLIAALYGSTVDNALVSDDYFWLGRVAGSPDSIFRYYGGYHYNPVTLAVLHVEYAIWGLNSTAYHIVTVALHVVATLLVARLGLALTARPLVAWISALLFATSSLAYEVPLWAVGVYYSLSTILFVLGFLAYADFRATGRRRSYGLFLALLFLALLTHEQTITLIVVCFFYELFVVDQALSRPWPAANWPQWSQRIGQWAKVFALPGLLIAGFILLKYWLANGDDLIPGFSNPLKIKMWSFVFSLSRALVPNLRAEWADFLFSPPWPVWIKALWRVFLVGGFVFVFLRLSRLGKFLVVWVAFQTGIMILAIGMDPRHYYLPLVPACILVASLVVSGADRVRRLRLPFTSRRVAGVTSGALFSMVIVAFVLLGIHDLDARKRAWSDASLVATNIIEDIGKQHVARPAAPNLYVVNLPDGLPSGDTAPAYVFRLGFHEAMAFHYEDVFDNVSKLRTTIDPWGIPFPQLVSMHELQDLAARTDNLVLEYDATTGHLQSLGRK